MTIHNSASAWWLGFSVPLYLIAIGQPIIGVTALGSAALVLLVSE